MSKYRNKQLTELAQMFKALANPHRLELFLRLTRCCVPGTRCAVDEIPKCCVGDLGAGLELAPSTISHHVKELHRAGLIQWERRGQFVDCWVNPAALERLHKLFDFTHV